MAEPKRITIDGVPGVWTPDDDGWEYLGQISQFENGYEYEYRWKDNWTESTGYVEGATPLVDKEYRRRPRQVWQGAGFYIVEGCTDLIPVIKSSYQTLPYITGSHTLANLGIVQLVRKFTDEEVRSIVDNGVWPENV